MRVLVALTCGLHVYAASLVHAEGFQTPSGNIKCETGMSDEYQTPDTVVQCTVLTVTEETYGNCGKDKPRVFTLYASNKFTEIDTQLDCIEQALAKEQTKLEYGQEWKTSDFSCVAQQSGLECRNTDGNGSAISKSSQQMIVADQETSPSNEERVVPNQSAQNSQANAPPVQVVPKSQSGVGFEETVNFIFTTNKAWSTMNWGGRAWEVQLSEYDHMINRTARFT